VLAAVCEAVIGAAYLANGWEPTRAAVVAAFADRVRFAETGHLDAKTALQEHLQRQARSVEYVVVDDTGPPHRRRFVSAALVDGVEVGRGEGVSKKTSEQEAAAAALDRLERGG
jgi:ribonuclease-3